MWMFLSVSGQFEMSVSEISVFTGFNILYVVFPESIPLLHWISHRLKIVLLQTIVKTVNKHCISDGGRTFRGRDLTT